MRRRVNDKVARNGRKRGWFGGLRNSLQSGWATPFFSPTPEMPKGQVDWFDYAKGICIILVVMMHSTLGVGEAFAEKGWGETGFMHWVVAYAKPFRMPDFFLLSGLFLSLAIGRGWLHYLDKKLVHFVYFYLLWTVAQAIIKTAATSGLDAAGLVEQFLRALIIPFPTLWFIYVLPLFFIVTKLLRFLPAPALLLIAAALQIAPVHTGWNVIDEFTAPYYVFFVAGYLLAPYVFALARWAERNVGTALLGVGVWLAANGVLALAPVPPGLAAFGRSYISDLPIISLALGAVGAFGIVVLASLLAKYKVGRLLAYCGKHSLVIYVSFAIPMAVTRVLLLKTGVVTDVGWASVTVWLTALLSPLLLHMIVSRTPLRFIYRRPAWFALPYERRVPQARLDLALAS